MEGLEKEVENLKWEVLRYCEDDVREFIRKLRHKFMVRGGFTSLVPKQTDIIEIRYWFQVRDNYRNH